VAGYQVHGHPDVVAAGLGVAGFGVADGAEGRSISPIPSAFPQAKLRIFT